MPQLLMIATSGAENPTRATLPFFLAKAAKESGKEVALVLAADSAPLASEVIRQNVTGVGFPPLADLYGFARDHGIPIYL
ncbi:MAG: DsrE family protein [Acidobacteria bacterium]|nr:DsrE family protein [Acidobacteriota bacterium]